MSVARSPVGRAGEIVEPVRTNIVLHVDPHPDDPHENSGLLLFVGVDAASDCFVERVEQPVKGVAGSKATAKRWYACPIAAARLCFLMDFDVERARADAHEAIARRASSGLTGSGNTDV